MVAGSNGGGSKGAGDTPAYSRRDVTFRSHEGECAAWLYLPDRPAPHATVVMAHGFGAIRSAGLPPYAERFADAGLAVLLFDYRNFGDSPGEPRQLLDVHAQHDDFRSAVAYVRSRGDLDDARVALWGTSFSGGHVLFLGAEYRTLAAIVAQVPYAGPGEGTKVPITDTLRMASLVIRDLVVARRGRPPVEIAIVGSPGSGAVMSTPDAEPGYLGLFPPHANWHNGIPARGLLKVGRYRPARHAEKINCPLLVQVGSHDAVTPSGPAVRAALRAPHGVARSFPIGHFDICAGDWFEQAVAEQTEFLVHHLLPAPVADPQGAGDPLITGAFS